MDGCGVDDFPTPVSVAATATCIADKGEDGTTMPHLNDATFACGVTGSDGALHENRAI